MNGGSAGRHCPCRISFLLQKGLALSAKPFPLRKTSAYAAHAKSPVLAEGLFFLRKFPAMQPMQKALSTAKCPCPCKAKLFYAYFMHRRLPGAAFTASRSCPLFRPFPPPETAAFLLVQLPGTRPFSPGSMFLFFRLFWAFFVCFALNGAYCFQGTDDMV